jgi:hypothetical protein
MPTLQCALELCAASERDKSEVLMPLCSSMIADHHGASDEHIKKRSIATDVIMRQLNKSPSDNGSFILYLISSHQTNEVYLRARWQPTGHRPKQCATDHVRDDLHKSSSRVSRPVLHEVRSRDAR